MGPASWHIWSYRALFVALALSLLAYRLLPLGISDGIIVPPDLSLALTLAWVLRQPAAVPIGSIVCIFLLADFLLQRPPGLWTALVLLATESLRYRSAVTIEINFLVEWLWVGVAVFAIILGERMVLWVLFSDLPSLGLTLMHGLTTLAVYPVVVVVSRLIFGVRRPSPADTEAV